MKVERERIQDGVALNSCDVIESVQDGAACGDFVALYLCRQFCGLVSLQ